MKLNVKTIGSKVLAAAVVMAVGAAQADVATAPIRAASQATAAATMDSAINAFSNSAMTSLLSSGTVGQAVQQLGLSNLVGQSIGAAERATISAALSSNYASTVALRNALGTVNAELGKMSSAHHAAFLKSVANLPVDQISGKVASLAVQAKSGKAAVQTAASSPVALLKEVISARANAVKADPAKLKLAMAALAYVEANPAIAEAIGADALRCSRDFVTAEGFNKILSLFGAFLNASSAVQASEQAVAQLLLVEYAGVKQADACRAIAAGLLQTDAAVVESARNVGAGHSCQIGRAFPGMQSACSFTTNSSALVQGR